MKIATQVKLGVATLAVALAPCVYGQTMPANTPEAKKAAAQLSEPAGPLQTTQDQQTDRTTIPGATANPGADVNNKLRQPLYENSAAAGGERDMSSNGMQRDSGSSRIAPNGRRGEIGVWLTANGGQGVRVGQVAAGGAADKAGLRSGDIILQVNGNSVASPTATAQQIRAVPIGQIATLTVLRDGTQNQMEVTLMAARPGQSYQVGYGGENGNGSNGNERAAMNADTSGLAARTSRLEQQVESMTEELRQMRQQMSSMSAGGTSPSGNGVESGTGIGTTPSAASPSPSSSATPPQAGSGSTTPSSSATPVSTPTSNTSPAAGGPSTPSAPPAGGSSGSADKDDLFGGSPSSSSSSPSGGTSK